MDVTDVLRDRMQGPPGLQGMAVVSFAVHAALGVFLILGPGRFFTARSPEPRTVMTISLAGGGAGPQSGGMTAVGGRPVQTTEPAPTREAVRPPAPVTPEMTLPKPGARAVKAPPKVVQAPQESRGRTPTRGAEVRAGSAIAETAARGQGFGLSSGGGAGSGSRLDVADFCCPEYLAVMIDRIRANWNHQTEISGQVVVKFTIQRDGALAGVDVEQPSGYTALDLAARRAVLVTKQLPSLPAAFPNPTLTVHLNFQYQR